MKVEEMFAGVPGLGQVAEDLPVPFKTIASTDLKPGDWLHLVSISHETVEAEPSLDGIV